MSPSLLVLSVIFPLPLPFVFQHRDRLIQPSLVQVNIYERIRRVVCRNKGKEKKRKHWIANKQQQSVNTSNRMGTGSARIDVRVQNT